MLHFVIGCYVPDIPNYHGALSWVTVYYSLTSAHSVIFVSLSDLLFSATV